MTNELAPRDVAFLTVGQVAERLQISRRHVWLLLARGDLAALRLGARTTRIPLTELERFVSGARTIKGT